MIASRPYPWPYHGALQPARTALLVFGGDGETEVDPEAVERLNIMIAAARRAGVTIIAVPHAGSRAALPAAQDAGELVIVRPHFGAFYGTDIDRILRER